MAPSGEATCIRLSNGMSLTSSLSLLAEEGAAGLTTTRVAEVAGVSVGSLYQYYPSRESLIINCLRCISI